MSIVRRLATLGLAAMLVLAACGADPTPTASTGPTPTPPPNVPATPTVDWHDPAQAPEARAAALLTEMTLDEKIGQMTQLEDASVTPDGARDQLLGSVLAGGNGGPPVNDVASWTAWTGAFAQAATQTRLGIPLLFGVDAVHGHAHVVGTTVFPHNVGLGAAADPELVERIGRVTAQEMAATGIRWDFAPVVAVPQDVRWGRTYEGFGEDPVLVSDLGSAMIRGLHGPDLTAADAVLATPKHFVGDGGTAWGSSTSNGYAIDQGVTDLDEATFRAIHLAPYEAAIDAGARVVMASFSSTGADKVHGDHHLLTEVLKGELGFTGFVVSDWAGVDQVAPDYDAAVAQSITAGIDMVMVPSDGRRFADAMRHGLDAGTILQTRVDDAVLRILRAKFEMGLFEQPVPAGASADTVGSDANRTLARDAVAASAVLLKTTPGLLPLDPGGKGAVLLTGSGADDIGTQTGGWTVTWQGSTGETTVGTTIREALVDRIDARVFHPGSRAFPEGTHEPLGIVVVAEPPYAEGLGDSATLALPDADLARIDEVRPLVDRLIVVILSGRPVMLDGILPQADAVIAAWLPGTEAQGLTDVLFGDVPFTATTPYTWPRTPDDAPRTGKEACDGAVFPMGFGLDATGKAIGSDACP